jgi:hypothetical protein
MIRACMRYKQDCYSYLSIHLMQHLHLVLTCLPNRFHVCIQVRHDQATVRINDTEAVRNMAVSPRMMAANQQVNAKNECALKSD